jgi:hypothetical protein
MEHRSLEKIVCCGCGTPLVSACHPHFAADGEPLCITCQHILLQKKPHTSPETIRLYLALRRRGVPAVLEKSDGHKTIDIAVPSARFNIEVDGPRHRSSQQAMSDLMRTYYAFSKGFVTLRIPNTLVRRRLDQTVSFILALLHERAAQLRA